MPSRGVRSKRAMVRSRLGDVLCDPLHGVRLDRLNDRHQRYALDNGMARRNGGLVKNCRARGDARSGRREQASWLL